MNIKTKVRSDHLNHVWPGERIAPVLTAPGPILARIAILMLQNAEANGVRKQSNSSNHKEC